ncbi:hypothetical protein COU62_04635 [Candidatus Pacearchaeota archaeon CG10_big_fil_rev_8_21_14_0_10_35_219]|nr:hypothetical protein [Candidatus Pacearchaeota archaeon]OIO41861.1 MAG: hypothetical protein AUJ63_04895 [Candidatus Pacearchaeota archaeon CG1_02_35_32]PIO07276.1 MAG: hypothetical protein COU62_04635 [Candidatus Pacearchaeota archaeon CG10_big_fil_rev_8_21_14_0_10_35_219]PIY81157.1 MAG: hypothetical protein COY79_03880 [Candidatus Pacearchaeota archaeon CG_4_10_14_0_8_um_filter_35_169]PIZ80016.1 MAG: hypothetical protein COY00_02535 [Candidatus Pacearchaeota archaeon CG_4_10_14_0_2_um_filt
MKIKDSQLFISQRQKKEMNRKGQVSIFIIVAVIIVAVIVLFFVVRDRIGEGVPAEFVPVYDFYSSCIEESAKVGANLAGMQGGRIFVTEYEPGSDYAPFSSHLDFLGSKVGYWYYLSGNGLIVENPPSINDVELEMEEFIKSSLDDCTFDEFYARGFYVYEDEAEVDVQIEDERILVKVISDLVVEREGNNARKTLHEVSVSSKLGKLYNIARDVYNSEKEDLFLEEYSIDVLRTYAPVDGVEVSCSPEIWKTEEVVNGLKEGLSENLASVKFRGNYYDLDNETDHYFVVDSRVSEPVRVVYFDDWPSKIEITGDNVDESLMVAEPVGNQEGLGVLGFCYVPYHYVYDVAFPVMIQVGDGLEMFQFPVVVIIDNNVAREADLSNLDYTEDEFDICEFDVAQADIYTYDNQLNPVEARVQYKCLDQTCTLGETSIENGNAILRANLPQCVNGKFIARADGYSDGELTYSSNLDSFADIILDREYDVVVNARVSGRELRDGESAIIYFVSEDGTSTAVLPENNVVNLKEGSYDISVYVYGDTGLVIPASSKTECIDVSKGGVLGLFGATKEECFEIDLPETKLENALTGGGRITTYLLENELESGSVDLEVMELPRPDSLEQLQINYQLFETGDVGVVFG